MRLLALPAFADVEDFSQYGTTNPEVMTLERLQAAEYDLDTVTPDADAWKYAPMF